MDAASISAGAATVLAAWQLVPQVVSLRRTPLVVGVSPTWALLGVATNGGWVLYRSSQELWLGVPSPAIAAALYGVTLILISRSQPRKTWAMAAGTGWICLLLGAAIVGGWPTLGTVLGVSSSFQAAPSLWAAFRSPSPSWIVPGVWLTGFAQALLWSYYGWWHTDRALQLYAVTTALVSFVMLARYRYTHRENQANSTAMAEARSDLVRATCPDLVGWRG